MPRCGTEAPELRDLGDRIVSCHLYDEAAAAANRAARPLAEVASAD
jgi:hypothetical protein